MSELIEQVCSDCSVLKPIHCYAKNKGYKHGYMVRCRLCDGKRRSARYRGENYTPPAPKRAPRKRTSTVTQGAPEVLTSTAPEVPAQKMEPTSPREVSPQAPPEVLPEVTPRVLGEVRMVTAQEFVQLHAGNISTLAAELHDIADAAVQDGRAVGDTHREIELQSIESRMERLVASYAAALGLVAQ